MSKLAPASSLHIVDLIFEVPTSGVCLSRYERVDVAWVRLDYFGDTFLRKTSLSNTNASKDMHVKLRAKWRIKRMLSTEHLKLLERAITRLLPGESKVVNWPPNFPTGQYVVGPRRATVRVTCSYPGEFEITCII